MTTPISIDSARLLAWHTADEVVPGGYAQKASGPGTKPVVNIQGSKANKGCTTLVIDSVAGGTGSGQATFSTYVDGGTTPIATGALTASAGVALVGACLGEIAYFPAGTYAVGQRWDQWPAVMVDQSQLGGDLWASNADYAATVESVGWNGRQSVVFDGVQSLMWARPQDLASRVCGGVDKEFHVYAAIQLLSTAAGQCVMHFGSQAGAFADFSLNIAAGPVWSLSKRDATGATVTVTGGVPDLSRHIIELHHTGTVVSMLVDGSPVTLSGGGAQNVGDMGSLDSAGLGLSMTVVAQNYCNMRFRERCIYGAGHTAFAAVRAYMLASSPL